MIIHDRGAVIVSSQRGRCIASGRLSLDDGVLSGCLEVGHGSLADCGPVSVTLPCGTTWIGEVRAVVGAVRGVGPLLHLA